MATENREKIVQHLTQSRRKVFEWLLEPITAYVLGLTLAPTP